MWLLDDVFRCRLNVIINYLRYGISKFMVLLMFFCKVIFKLWEIKNLKKFVGCMYNFERENMFKSYVL